MTTSNVEAVDGAALALGALLLGDTHAAVEVTVHDASRFAWNVTIPLPEDHRAPYAFELELEVPANVGSAIGPWPALQSYARLDGGEGAGRIGPTTSCSSPRSAC